MQKNKHVFFLQIIKHKDCGFGLQEKAVFSLEKFSNLTGGLSPDTPSAILTLYPCLQTPNQIVLVIYTYRSDIIVGVTHRCCPRFRSMIYLCYRDCSPNHEISVNKLIDGKGCELKKIYLTNIPVG
jgi:hypothetical protein